MPFVNHLFIHALAIYDNEGNRLDNDQRAAKKQKLISNIERLGGKVVHTFSSILQWGGKISDKCDRWVWNAGDFQQAEDEPPVPTAERNRRTGSFDSSEPPKIFLVADGPNETTKYLLALAAGIPCVDQGWVYNEVS
jgi:hypothetical protein